MSKVVIFGAGKVAEVAYFHFTRDSPHEIVAFTTDADDGRSPTKLGLPVVPFAELEGLYPPGDVKAFVAIGYQDLNHLRARKFVEIKRKGYELVSYVSSRASNIAAVEVGQNCLVLDFSVIQPGATIGDDVFIWSANHVGHHAAVGDHVYLSGHVVISGGVVIEPYCYVGVNVSLGHAITIGRESFIGAGALITKNVAPKSVHVVSDTAKHRLDTASFMQITRM